MNRTTTYPFTAALFSAIFTALAVEHGFSLSYWVLLGAAVAGTIVAYGMTTVSNWLIRLRSGGKVGTSRP